MKPRIFHTRNYAPASVYRSEAVTLFAAHSVQLSSPQKTVVNYVIDTLITAGAWAQCDVIWFPCLVTEQQSCLNWKNPAANTLVPVNFASSFVTKVGYPGNGTDRYINTNFNPSTQGVNYTTGSCSFGCYLKDNLQDDGYAMGATDGYNTFIRPRDTSGLIYGRINGGGGGGVSNTDSSEFHSLSTVDAANIVFKKNATTLTTVADASSLRPNLNMFLYARNNATTADNFSGNTIQGAAAGSGTVNYSLLKDAANYLKANL